MTTGRRRSWFTASVRHVFYRAAKKPLNVALFLPFRWVNTLSLRHDELYTMTELATSALALMLTIEVGVAIAFAVS